MVRWMVVVLVTLATTACAGAPPLAATVTEDGTPIGVERVSSFTSVGRDVFFVSLDDGRGLHFDVAQPRPSGPLGFEGPEGEIPAVRVELSAPPHPGTDTLPQLCDSERGASGNLIVRGLSRNADGDIDGLDATLTVRFEACDAMWEGRSLDGVTFVVELPGGA